MNSWLYSLLLKKETFLLESSFYLKLFAGRGVLILTFSQFTNKAAF